MAGDSSATWGTGECSGCPIGAYTASFDAFAARLNSSGGLTWNTFLGGNGDDWGSAIAVDGSGNVYVAGQSPTTWGSPVRAYTGGRDAFAARLNSSGGLTWNTFLGGNGDDWGGAIAVDGGGNVVVAGYSDATWGSPVRPYTAGYDAFAARLNGSGGLTWNTFLGGSAADVAYAIAVNGSGNVYVAGYSEATWGAPVRAHQGGVDAFAAKLDSGGNLTWNTFLGGSGADWGYAVVAGGSDNAYVAGRSAAAWGLPVRGYTGGSDAFVAKLTSGVLTWNTFLGGGGDDFGYAIAVDEYGDVYVAGQSPTTWGAPVRAYAGGRDAFAAKVNSNSGALTWNTFLGGNGDDDGYAIAVHVSGNVYVAGRSDATWGSPIRAYTADWDAFVSKLSYRLFLPLIMR